MKAIHEYENSGAYCRASVIKFLELQVVRKRRPSLQGVLECAELALRRYWFDEDTPRLHKAHRPERLTGQDEREYAR